LFIRRSCTMSQDVRLKLAIQNKGRIGGRLPKFFEQAGLIFEFQERQLIARCQNFPIDLLFVRHSDIPLLVTDGVADLGVVGRDLVAEKMFDVQTVLPLGLARSALCLAVPERSGIASVGQLAGKKVATHFPNLTQQFFDQNQTAVEILPLRGSVEIAPQLDLAEAIVDLVGTGATLAVNRLKVIATLLESEAVLISSQLNGEKQIMLDALTMRFQSVIGARDKKLLIFNLPKAALPDLQNLHLGLSGPTISELNGDSVGMVAVQVVVGEAESWEIMSRIKSIGGSGILVLNIERLID